MVKKNSDALAAGHELNGSKYRIKCLLGDGGFGLTYLADDLDFEREVAIKEFFPRSYARRMDGSVELNSEEYREQFKASFQAFKKEGRALARCSHSGVVQVFDRFEEGGTAYMVMQLIQGRELDDWIKQNDGDFIKVLLPQLLDALEYIHNKKLVHRDLKPANIMVRDENNQPVLIDFGATRIDYDREAKTSIFTTTEAYAAPELFAGSETSNVTPASDLYALGVILYRYVTGELPPKASERMNNNDELVPVAKKASPEFTQQTGLLKAIDAALIMNHRERIQEVSAFRELISRDAALDYDLETSTPSNESILQDSSEIQNQSGDEKSATPQPKEASNNQSRHSSMLNSIKRHGFLAFFCVTGSCLFFLYVVAYILAFFGNTLYSALVVGSASAVLASLLAFIYEQYWRDDDNIRDDIALFIGLGMTLCLSVGVPQLFSKDYEEELCKDFYARSFLNPLGLQIVSLGCQVTPDNLKNLLNTTDAFPVHLRAKDQRNVHYTGEHISLELKRNNKKYSRLLIDYILPNSDGNLQVWHQSKWLNWDYQDGAPIKMDADSDPDKKAWIVSAALADSKWPTQIQATVNGKEQESLNSYYARLLQLKSSDQLPNSIVAQLDLKSELPTIKEDQIPDMATAAKAVQALKKALPNQGGVSLQSVGEDHRDLNGRLRFYIDLRNHKGFTLNHPYIMMDFLYVTKDDGLVVNHQMGVLNKQEEWVNTPLEKNDRMQQLVLIWLSDQKWPTQFQSALKKEKPQEVWQRLRSYAKSGADLKVAFDDLDLR